MSASAGRPNATDVMFLQMMIAREAETAQLIQVADTRPLAAEISTLTAAVRSTQADEARTMKQWLRDWDQPTTMSPVAAAHSHHGGLDRLHPADLAALSSSPPGTFPTRLLNLLIGRQHNTVELARAELATGTDPRTRELARRVQQSRNAQIAAMLKMVAGAERSP